MIAFLAASPCLPSQGPPISGFTISPFFDEQVRMMPVEDGVRVALNAPSVSAFKIGRPTRVIFYATPNGNTIEQTLGCRAAPGLDWHFDIQHIAAQIRHCRELGGGENLVLACVQPMGLSWPAWRARRDGGAKRIRKLVQTVSDLLPGASRRITLASHSGGGSFIWGFLNGGNDVPAQVDRIIFLDSNYSYDDKLDHGDKLLAWLRRSWRNHLVIIAYDDREILFNGKKVVGPKGGTFRACERMLARFRKDLTVDSRPGEPLEFHQALKRRFTLIRHLNPENKILHTALVGDMSGFTYALTLGTRLEKKWGFLGGPRTYSRWIQPIPGAGTTARLPLPDARRIPPRAPRALGGRASLEKLVGLALADREKHILAEIERGNVPTYMRRLVTIRVREKCPDGRFHTAEYRVVPDYLALGGDRDAVRVPLTPMSAQRIADTFGFALPTSKMVDQIHRSAKTKLEPRPMTKERQALRTFLEHNDIIESQRGKARSRGLLAGIKKDLVVTPRLASTSGRVAIYGWHHKSGKPIQPLYTGHIATYVDYSHGVRLVSRELKVDGKKTSLSRVLSDPSLHFLLSDEGALPLSAQRYRY